MKVLSNYKIAKIYNALFLIPLAYVAFYPDSITDIDPVFLGKISKTLLFVGLLYHVYMLSHYLQKN